MECAGRIVWWGFWEWGMAISGDSPSPNLSPKGRGIFGYGEMGGTRRLGREENGGGRWAGLDGCFVTETPPLRMYVRIDAAVKLICGRLQLPVVRSLAYGQTSTEILISGS